MTALDFPADSGAFDIAADSCESPLLDPGSDGLVQGNGGQILDQLADYQDAGHSLDRIYRDFALDKSKVRPSHIRNAADYARLLRSKRTGTAYRGGKVWGGFEMPYKTIAARDAAMAHTQQIGTATDARQGD